LLRLKKESVNNEGLDVMRWPCVCWPQVYLKCIMVKGDVR
jgi:hypothetical protein